MSIEIEPRSLAATRRVALVLALLGLAACGTTGVAVTGNPTIDGLTLLASPVLEMAGDSFRDFTHRHRHGGHVSLDDAYVALGDCGCTGGVFGESYASRGRVSNIIPVDVAVPGCPPTPTRILQGILTAFSNRREQPPMVVSDGS
ncbi:MAG: hypothetical protein ACLPTM_01630 [Steroidobacteraceae bacterium]